MTADNYKQAIKERAFDIVTQANEIVDLAEGIPVIPDTDPDPHPEPIPPPDLQVVIMKKKAPLFEVSHYNGKGKPVLRIRGGRFNRIIAKAGKELMVLGKVAIDGGKAWRIYSAQMVDGDWLPESNSKAKHPTTKRIDKYFYLPTRLVNKKP